MVQRPGGDPRRIDSEWTRVDPFTRIYPRDAWGFAEPGLVENTDANSRDDFPFKTVVLGTGQAYSQLLHRARSADVVARALVLTTCFLARSLASQQSALVVLCLVLSLWLVVCAQWGARAREWACGFPRPNYGRL